MLPGKRFLLGDFLGIPVGVADTAGINRCQHLKIAQPCRRLEGNEILLNGMAKETVSGVKRLRCPRCEGENQLFTTQFRRGTMRETVNKNFIQPLFHESRESVPGKRELPDNHIGPEQAFLLRSDIEFAVRIEPVQTTNFSVGQGCRHLVKDGGVGDRMVKFWMSGNDKDICHFNQLCRIDGCLTQACFQMQRLKKTGRQPRRAFSF
ncbi:hypothetical protein EcWSU1_02207 [Enterobacter ludwigii]|uniref:Uncharacterized protein n=1 Tax=Enterobacter ludwigii TaxID=299767 RepID=G8LPI6_9ENTR|nr:hypothetical protein EcWSU1_02207 [Enterobacter ludwigii]